MITINQLSKKYKEAEQFSVSKLNLEILDGEIFGLLGPNGAGKTTLISMLSGLIKPTSGSFSINGLDYSNSKKELKKHIGIVPQEYALYPDLTAVENLNYFGAMYGLKGSDFTNSVQEHLSILGLSDFARKKVKSYSGGMKRRVNLIASILHKPKVLFLDEPTVGVDVQSKTVIIDYLKELNHNGTTIIYTSHHLNEAEHLCTRVGIIDHGELVGVGTPKDLIAKQKDAAHLEDVFLELTGKALRDHV